MSESRQRQESRYSFVPAIDDILAPPPPAVEPESKVTQVHDGGLGFVVVSANVLVTAIIIIGMLVEGQQASRAIVVGAVYFASTTVIYAFIHTGALSAIIGVWQHERTERVRIQAYASVAEMAIGWRIRVEENRTLELQMQATPGDMARRLAQVENELMDHRLAADPPQGVSTYVAPYDNRSRGAFAEAAQPDTTAQEALAWARTLYLDSTGLPDPDRVQTSGEQEGWLKGRMLGSKRGTGSKEAGLWLLHHKIILRAAGGYKLNTQHYPRRESLRNLL
jgi:hypothetical protein